MSVINYIPPGQRLFRSRHRVTRRDLQNLSDSETDWSTVLDLPIDTDSQLISYAVPVLGVPVMEQYQDYNQSNRSTMCSESSYISSASSVFDSDLETKMQGNLSLESLIQENKKRISEHEDSLNLFSSLKKGENVNILKTETKRDVQRLKYENRHLLFREHALEKLWSKIRSCKDRTILLIEISRNGLYWFGLPGDIRDYIYHCCLYRIDYISSTSIEKGRVYSSIQRCIKNDKLSLQINTNISRNASWLDGYAVSSSPYAHAIEARIYAQYSGLHYHLKEILKLNIFKDFVQPLVVNSLANALNFHSRDKIGLELLDVIIISMYHKDLNNFLLNDFLFCVLNQTHFKFFSNDFRDIKIQLDNPQFELVEILETLRQKHGAAVLNSI